MDEQLIELVRARAAGRCEYCQIPEGFSEAPFVVEHVIARQHRDQTVPSNLAWSCLRCNLYKGPNISGIDPRRSPVIPVRLFHPRRHRWPRHFRWQGPVLVGKTAIDRATIEVLNLNHPDRVRVREVLIEAGLFPPL